MSIHNETLEQALEGGHVLNSGEGVVTTTFGGILAVTDTVLATLSCNLTNSADLVGETIAAGTYIPTKITSISLTSGTAIGVTSA